MNETHDDRPIARGAALDWNWDWAAWMPAGDAIAAASIVVTDELAAGTPTSTDTSVSALITCSADAAIGLRQRATCTITTTAGLTDSRTIRLVVAAR